MSILTSKIKNKTLLIKTVKLSLVSLVSNFLGFLIPIYIAFEYNISKETDSFFLSYTIILFVGVVFSGAVRSVSIPYLQERLDNKEKLVAFNKMISILGNKFVHSEIEAMRAEYYKGYKS